MESLAGIQRVTNENVSDAHNGHRSSVCSSADRGVVLIADSRIVSKAYGQALLEALPPARRLIAPLAEVVHEVRSFYA